MVKQLHSQHGGLCASLRLFAIANIMHHRRHHRHRQPCVRRRGPKTRLRSSARKRDLRVRGEARARAESLGVVPPPLKFFLLETIFFSRLLLMLDACFLCWRRFIYFPRCSEHRMHACMRNLGVVRSDAITTREKE